MALLVYVTCANMNEAKRIGAELLDAHLAACVNIVSAPVVSMYFWNGQREESQEVLLLAKTMEDRFAALNHAIRGLHSYEIPCIIALPLAGGDADYLAWIEKSTRVPQTA